MFPKFLVIWIGQLLSRLGSGMSAFALGVYLFRESGSTTAYSLLLLCAFLPSVLLAPVGGIIADRNNRLRMMVFGDIGAAFGVLFALLMLLADPGRNWAIYLGVAISSLFVALHSPAFKASVTDLLDEKEYAKASGLIQLAEASRYLLAPVIAASLMTQISLAEILLIDVLTFVAAAASVAFVRKAPPQPHAKRPVGSFRDDLMSGIRYIVGSRLLFNLLCLTSLVTFFTGILQSLFVPIVLSFTDTATLGRIQSIAAGGLLLSSLLIGVRGKTADQGKVLCLSLLFAGVFYLLIGISRDQLQITLATFCLFLTLPYINTSLEVLFRQNISSALQGRVWSLISFVSQGGMLVAFGVSGILADHFLNPLLTPEGRLADNVGKVLGTGAARGSGLMIVVSGCVLIACSVIFSVRSKKEQGRSIGAVAG